MLNAMERSARQAGYFAITVAVRFDSPESWAEGLQHLSRMHVEGIATFALQSEVIKMAAKIMPTIKLIAIDTDDQANKVNAVGIDNLGGGHMATRHLIELGHKKILHIMGPSTSSEAQNRRRGYEQAMAEAGLEPAVVQGDWTAETGFRIGIELNLELTGYTAIFTANDQLSLGLMKAFNMRGVSVPREISLVGFDDIPESPYFNPPLTTIRQDFNQLGEVAIEMLLSDLAGTKRKKFEALKPNLIVRDSAIRISTSRK
jgi:DNA-binding LacI/PurR family transcriptional regulator